MIITTSLYLAHFTTGPLYLFYILAVVTFPVAVAKSGIALLQVKTQSCSQNNPSQFVFRDILLLSTWLAWTPRRGRRSRRSRGLYFRVCRLQRLVEAPRGGYSWLYTPLCTCRGLLGLASFKTKPWPAINHCWMATVLLFMWICH